MSNPSHNKSLSRARAIPPVPPHPRKSVVGAGSGVVCVREKHPPTTASLTSPALASALLAALDLDPATYPSSGKLYAGAAHDDDTLAGLTLILAGNPALALSITTADFPGCAALAIGFDTQAITDRPTLRLIVGTINGLLAHHLPEQPRLQLAQLTKELSQ